MFLVWKMNTSQQKDIDRIIYLMKKSKQIAKRESSLMQEPQELFLEYAWSLIGKVRDSKMKRWEVQHHLWAMHKTIELRITTIKNRQIWIGG